MIKLVPITEAAEAVGVSRVTVFKYVARGLLKRYRRPGLDRRTYVDLVKLRGLRSLDERAEEEVFTETDDHV